MNILALNNLLPLTVISAVSLFIIKEIIEITKKYTAKTRQIKAIKIIIANELELNSQALRQLYSTLNTVKELLSEFDKAKFNIITTYDQLERFRYKMFPDTDNFYSGWSLPKFNIKRTEDLILTIAILDSTLLTKVQETLEEIKTANQIRSNLIDAVINEDSFLDDDDLKEGFYTYAIDVKEDIEKSMNKLYWICTNRELEIFKPKKIITKQSSQ